MVNDSRLTLIMTVDVSQAVDALEQVSVRLHELCVDLGIPSPEFAVTQEGGHLDTYEQVVEVAGQRGMPIDRWQRVALEHENEKTPSTLYSGGFSDDDRHRGHPPACSLSPDAT